MPASPIIEVEDLVKSYDGRRVLNGVSFSVAEGEVFGIVGPNGSGKTTTVESVAGLRHPESGSIRVLGMDPQERPSALRERLGVQLQESQLPDRIEVGEVLALYSSFYADPLPWDDLLDQIGLTDKISTRFKSLSGGQRQRLSIALALVGNPEIAILDELTTGLDPQARRDTWSIIEGVRDRGVTIILVTHFMEEAERLADRVAVIDAGKVIALDTPKELVARVDTTQQLRFRPSAPLDGTGISDLPEVSTVSERDGLVSISGTGNLVHAVTSALARERIVAYDLRTDQATLDDAYLALTGRAPESAVESNGTTS